MILARLLRRWSIGKDNTTAAVADNRIIRPDFETMFFFWTGLLAERGLPEAVRWVFHEDFARVHSTRDWRFAFRLRPATEADRVARFAYAHLDPKKPLAIVAYAVLDDFLVTAGVDVDPATYSVNFKMLDGSELKFSLRALFAQFFEEVTGR
jgi:hypothetical protein